MNPSSLPQPAQPPEGVLPDNGSSVSSPSPASQGQGIKHAMRSATDTVKTKVSETASALKNQATETVQEKRNAASERIGGYSSAVHETASNLEEKDPNIAWFTHRAAERLQGVADYVRDRDFRSLKTDVEGIARRHPIAFFGGLFVAGLVLGNIVKATSSSAQNTFDDENGDEFFPEESYDDDSRPYSSMSEATPGSSYATSPATPLPSQT